MLVSKNEQKHRSWFPISSGAHSLAELALLLQQGLSWAEIAQRWGLRPRAGAADLRFDVEAAWMQAGCPGGLPEPQGYGHAAKAGWAAWRQAREAALPIWLDEQIKDGIPAHHCPTCRCRLPATTAPASGEDADPSAKPMENDAAIRYTDI